MATTFQVAKNRAKSALAADITSAVTSLTVTAGEGTKFPSTYPFPITIEDEILKCTNRSTDTLTVERAQEGTTAAAHATGKAVHLRITAKFASDLHTAVNTVEDKIAYVSAARAERATSVQSIPATTNTKVQLNSEIYDTQGEFDPVTNYRFTAKQAGYYMVSCSAELIGLADGKRFFTIIFKNGAVYCRNCESAGAAANIWITSCTGLYLAANDYVEMWVWHDDTVARDLNYEEHCTAMSINKVG